MGLGDKIKVKIEEKSCLLQLRMKVETPTVQRMETKKIDKNKTYFDKVY